MKLSDAAREVLRRLVLASGDEPGAILDRLLLAHWRALGEPAIALPPPPPGSVRALFVGDPKSRISTRAALDHYQRNGGVVSRSRRELNDELRALGGRKTTLRVDGRVVDGWMGIRWRLPGETL